MMRGYRHLIQELALTDFKLRYNASVLGYLWSLLNPLLQFAVLFLVFSIFLRFDIPHYKLYLLLGVVIWGFLAESTSNAMVAMLNKASLVKKIYFPRKVIIVSSNLTTTFGFILNMIVFALFFIISGAHLTVYALFLPLYILILLIMIFGLSLLLSSLYVRFRDVHHLWGIVLQLGFWLTPIVYPLSLVPEKIRFLFNLNPMYGVIHNLRETLIYGRAPDLFSTIVLVVLAILVLIIGWWMFNKLSKDFAEYL